jgi:hypothetical protein
MKYIAVLLLQAAIAAAVTSDPSSQHSLQRTASGTSNETVKEVPGVGPYSLEEIDGVKFQAGLSKPVTPGSTLTKIRYGPYKVYVSLNYLLNKQSRPLY